MLFKSCSGLRSGSCAQLGRDISYRDPGGITHFVIGPAEGRHQLGIGMPIKCIFWIRCSALARQHSKMFLQCGLVAGGISRPVTKAEVRALWGLLPRLVAEAEGRERCQAMCWQQAQCAAWPTARRFCQKAKVLQMRGMQVLPTRWYLVYLVRESVFLIPFNHCDYQT